MLLGISGLANSGKDTVAKFLGEDLRFVGIAFADPLKQIAKTVYRFTDDQLWGPSHMRNTPDKRYPRSHTWVLADRLAEHEMTCACCGAGANRRLVEDDLLVVNEEDVSPCYLTPRYALQLLGTEWGRQCYPDTWALLGVTNAKELLGPNGAGLRYDRARGIWRSDRHPTEKAAGVAITDVRFKNEMRVIREGGGKVIRVRRPGAGLGGGAGLHPSEAEQASIPDSAFDAIIENDETLDVLRARSHDTLVSLGATGY